MVSDSSSSGQTVVLRDGSEEPQVLVAALMVQLRQLFSSAPMVFYDAVMHARTGKQQFNAARLEEIGLTQGGVMHDSIQHVIRSAVQGDGFNMILSDPVSR